MTALVRIALLLAAVGGTLALDSAALAAEPTPRRTYEGQAKGCVGRCPTVKLRVTRSVRKMHVTVTWQASCDSTGGVIGGKNVYDRGTKTKDPIPVRRDGRFSVKGNYREQAPESYGGPEGLTASVAFRLRGRFSSRRRASGRFSVAVVLRDPAGATRDRCRGSERFTATRR